jgi:WD40 repeat protein
MDWSPEGARLATGSADSKAAIWDASNGEVVSFYAFEGMVGALLFDPSGRRVLAGDSDGKLLTFDARTGERTSDLRNGPERAAPVAARHPDGERMATGTINGATITWRWDVSDVRLLIPDAPAPEMNYILDAAPSPDGRLVASASRSSGVDLWDPRNGRRLYHVEVPGGAGAVVFSRDGSRLIAAHASGAISVTAVATGHLESLFDAHPAPPDFGLNIEGLLFITALDIHPGGVLLASASADRTIRISEISGARRHVLAGHADHVYDVKFSPDGTILASCSADSTIRLWDVEIGREIAVLRGHHSVVHSICFSPDGALLASASNDCTVRSWDVRRRGPLTTLSKQANVMTAVAYSTDGTRLAAGGGDKGIWILDPMKNREVIRLQGHVGRIKSLRFGFDDALLVSASIDGTVGIWDIAVPTESRSLPRRRGATPAPSQATVINR